MLHSGHIHDTYFVETDAPARYVLQRVNHRVFKQPEVVMDNIRQATEHQLRYFAANGLDTKVPESVAVRAGGYLHQDASGNFWRIFTYIPDTVSVEKAETPEQAFEAARMFGRFSAALRDLPASRLPETIPGFHDAVRRRSAFADAVANGLPERRAAAPEVAFFTARSPIADRLAGLLARGEVPLRIVHNDTKISNVLLDAATGRGVCAIDLDTVMPGTLLYDFGDMMRTFLSPASEDETDLSQVRIRMDVFEALAKGYWAAFIDGGAGKGNAGVLGKNCPKRVVSLESRMKDDTDCTDRFLGKQPRHCYSNASVPSVLSAIQDNLPF